MASSGGCRSEGCTGSGQVPRKASHLSVPKRAQLCTGVRLQWQQFTALNKKNLLIRGRAWKTNLLLVAQAALFVVLTWGVDQGVTASRKRQPAFRNEPQARPISVGSVPDCGNSMFLRQGAMCYTVLYAPQGVGAVEKVMWGVAKNNDPPIPSEHVRGFQNSSQIDEFLLAHPETVLGAVVFTVDGPGDAGNVRSIGFTVQTNSSVQWFKGKYQDPNTYMQIPLQSAVERELVRYLAGQPELGWDVELTQFPHPASQSPSMIGQFAPTFLFASIMFQFVLLVHDVVCEKESGVRCMMTTMGLRPLPFWASWALFQGLLAVVEACLLVGFSWAFGFELFVENAFLLSFLLLLLVSLAMTAFGFFVTSFLRQASAAVPAGFVMFVLAWIFLVVIAFGFPFSTKYSTVAVAAFSTMPWTLLAKGIQDLADASEGRLTGLPWSQRFSYCQADALSPQQQAALAALSGYWQEGCVMPLGQIYWVLVVQCAAYMALALYFDAILPDGNGVKRPAWFLLQPSFWFPSKARNLRPAEHALGSPAEWEEGLLVDPDVQQESEKMRECCRHYLVSGGRSVVDGAQGMGEVDNFDARMKSSKGASSRGLHQAASEIGGGLQMVADCRAIETVSAIEQEKGLRAHGTKATTTTAAGVHSISQHAQQAQHVGRRYAVEMYGLRKEYCRGGLFRRRPFVAVRGSWLGIHEGECFCLLGPNGAGKSTTIHCLTGVLPFTSGDALVYGESIASSAGMDSVRSVMGVCPQFDVLWDNLTGREHLHLFAAIKGLPSQGRTEEAATLLDEVRLSEAGSVRAGAYSGGMKRRLSVAIALLGDPKVVYLDEPTTGLDPISRRHLWDLIDKAKRQRAIVLTTHSMEEADILGDRIGIMARGRLRCIANSLRLKSRFGSGYRISVRVQGSDPSPTLSHWNKPNAAQGGPTPINPTSSLPSSDSTALAEGPVAVLTPRSRMVSLVTIPAVHGAASSAQHALHDSDSGCEIQPEPRQHLEDNATGSRDQKGAWGPKHTDPMAAVQMARVKAVFLDRLGVKSVDEAQGYLHFLVPYENEDKLPMLFTYLKAHSWELGIADIQLRLTSLEEVFLNVTRKAELEHAQAEGRYEMLCLPDENIAIKVPIGAEFIQSPGGHLYHIKWAQDESGALKLQDYWRDPVSAAVLEGADESSCDGSEGEELEGNQGELSAH